MITKEEAIEHLKNIKIYSFQDGYTDEAREALDMAIKALEAQAHIINCPDCKYAIRNQGEPYSCEHLPKPGQLVRYNCPFYERKEDTDE